MSDADLNRFFENLGQARQLAARGAQDNYFRGLVSSKLGPNRTVDDELIELVAGDSLFAEILDDLIKAPDQPQIRNEVESLGPSSSLLPPTPDAVTLCRVLWRLAVQDPRFDLLLKAAIEDTQAGPAPVRGSVLSALSGILQKLGEALSTGAAQHSSAVLVASLAAGLLAGGTADHVLSNNAYFGGSHTVSNSQGGAEPLNVAGMDELIKSMTEASNGLHDVASRMAEQNNVDARLVDLEHQAMDHETRLGKLEGAKPDKGDGNKAPAPWPSDLIIQKSLTELVRANTSLAKATTQLEKNTSTLDGNLKNRTDGLNTITGKLDEIARRIGPGANTASGTPDPKTDSNTSKSSNGTSSATSVVQAIHDASESTKEPLNQLAYSQPTSQVLIFAGTQSSDILTFWTGTKLCEVTMKLAAVTRSSATLSADADDCYKKPNSPIVLSAGHEATLTPGNNTKGVPTITLQWAGVRSWAVWQIKPQSVAIQVLRQPVGPAGSENND